MAEKTVRIVIAQLRRFRKILKTPIMMPLPSDGTILDVIGNLDEKYFKITEGDGEDHSKDFLDDHIHSLMQLLWNPTTAEFYDDVGVECRTSPDLGSESVPIEKDPFLSLGDGDWAVLTPDSGC
jgi:hypothetical protein